MILSKGNAVFQKQQDDVLELSNDVNLNKMSVKQVCLLLAAVLSIFFGYEVGNRPFADPDEGRYVEIPREMVVTGDYVTPRLNGLKYFEKPPLFYWLQAASIKCAGITERSMRFWPVFFAVLGCLTIFGIGVACGSISLGLVSAWILATNLLYYAMSHIIILDLAVSVLISGVLWCFFLAFVKKRREDFEDRKKLSWITKNRKFFILLMYALAALACLTKGLIGVVIPGFVGGLWMYCSRNFNWNTIREIIYLPGILVFLVIFLPWHIMVCSRNGDFFHFYFVVEHWLRYTTQIHKRYQPIWYFFPVVLGGLLPWTGFCLSAINGALQKIMEKKETASSKKEKKWQCSSSNSENLFLLCWIFGILGFYSFSNSKLIPYILPIFPPIAFLTARMLTKVETASEVNFKIGAYINIVLSALIIGAFFWVKDPISDVTTAFPEVLVLIRIFGMVLCVCAILPICLLFSKKEKIILGLLIFYAFLSMNMMWIVNKAAPFYQAIKKPSTKEMAEIVRMNFREENGDEVFCHKRYRQDFPVYLERTIGVTDYLGELRFGNEAEKNNKMISEEQLWKKWNLENKKIFVLMTRHEYQEFFSKNIPHVLLHFDKNFVVIVNPIKSQKKREVASTNQQIK